MEDAEIVDARKTAVGPDEIPDWFKGRKRLVVAKGKKWAEHTVKDLAADERVALVVGPSGKLRAPALVAGDALVVGFHEEAYGEIFD